MATGTRLRGAASSAALSRWFTRRSTSARSKARWSSSSSGQLGAGPDVASDAKVGLLSSVLIAAVAVDVIVTGGSVSDPRK